MSPEEKEFIDALEEKFYAVVQRKYELGLFTYTFITNKTTKQRALKIAKLYRPKARFYQVFIPIEYKNFIGPDENGLERKFDNYSDFINNKVIEPQEENNNGQ